MTILNHFICPISDFKDVVFKGAELNSDEVGK